jgi:hypothetical protein
MANILLNKGEKAETRAQDAPDGQGGATPESSHFEEVFKSGELGAYNAKNSYTADLIATNRQEWEKSKLEKDTPWYQQPLRDTVRRTLSRGLAGAAGYTLGGYYFSKAMSEYAPHLPSTNIVQKVAKVIDSTITPGIAKAVSAMGHDGEAFVTFRKTGSYPGYGAKGGRSLAHEAIMVTGDFASMSIADFWARKTIDTIDANGKKPDWKRDDGSIDWNKAVKTFGKNWYTALTYAAGEDMAVAIPYVLMMEHSTVPLLNKAFPGYRFDHDRNANGGSMIIDGMSRVNGNFTGAGVMALVKRFTEYNVGTLLFRESYHWMGTRLAHLWDHKQMPALVKPDPENPNRTPMQTAADGVKQFGMWLGRSAAKATMYMIPSAALFGAIRVPQHKFRGLFIHPEKGVLMHGERKLLHAAALEAGTVTAETPVFFSQTGEAAINPFTHGKLQTHVPSRGAFDAVLVPVGKATDAVRESLRAPVGKAINGMFGIRDGASYAETALLASMAYVPYFWAKSDVLADKWDTGWMDVALERTIKGGLKGDRKEIRGGVGEIGHALMNEPFSDPSRELYAECRNATKEAPSDNEFDINPNAGESCDFLQPKYAAGQKVTIGDPGQLAWAKRSGVNAPKPEKTHELTWLERTISATPDRPEPGHDGASLADTYKIARRMPTDVNERPMRSYAEQQKMREALVRLVPPTNAIN